MSLGTDFTQTMASNFAACSAPATWTINSRSSAGIFFKRDPAGKSSMRTGPAGRLSSRHPTGSLIAQSGKQILPWVMSSTVPLMWLNFPLGPWLPFVVVLPEAVNKIDRKRCQN